MQAPTTDQIRNAIDSGTTGEKVSMPDPAAAPLGTDDEAAGNPPTAEERAMTARQMPQMPQSTGRSDRVIVLSVGIVVTLAVMLVVIMFWALQ